MNSVEYVTTHLEQLIQQGASKPEIVRSIAISCEGWPYVFGAWGEQCTPANRRRRKRDDHPTIVSACQVLSGKKSSCTGCKWNLPVWMFDCRGFTDKMLSLVGIDLKGEGATSQWDTKANWAVQGPISEMPRDKVCCVFVRKGNRMQHTGLYLGDGSTAECSAGVQYFKKMKDKWTHYAIPAGLYDGKEIPMPEITTDKPTLRKGARGDIVRELQERLIRLGYELPKYGADGDYGAETVAAVTRFQREHGLTADGICGPRSWAALLADTGERYTVTVPHLTRAEAEELIRQHSGATMTKEGGD